MVSRSALVHLFLFFLCFTAAAQELYENTSGEQQQQQQQHHEAEQEQEGEQKEEESTDPNDEFKNSPVTGAVAVAGGAAVLPCNITSVRGDAVQLVLWYRDHVPTPVFSYDARSGAYSRPKEWSDPKILGSRAHFSLTSAPAALVFNQTVREDQAVYRCRVDYKHLTTTHARVNLTVVEPVRSVRIVDEGGTLELVGVAGPYTLGQRPTLTCRAEGGDPPPAVTWWRDGRLLDSTYHHLSTAGTNRRVGEGLSGSLPSTSSSLVVVVVNMIHLRALKKEDLRSTYTCRATNHDLAPTREVAVEVDMNFGPESVTVKGLEGPVSAGRPHQVVCEARGSRPPAILTWWLDGEMKKSVSHMTSLDGLVSTSTLELVIEPEDEGSQLTCRAENPELPRTTMEDSHQLQVLYPPEVKVEAGSSLDLNHIKEGDDVYFDCHIKARPDPHKVTWSFKGSELQQNVSGGVMVVGKSLVLQKVSRSQAGPYACSATNTQGRNTSLAILLSVKYAPVCRVEQSDVYGVGRHEKTTVTCRVEADPPVTTYRWAFNNTGEFVDIPSSHYDIKGEGIKSQHSDLRYSPVSDLDYGTLLCWATNPVGTQRSPCTFTVFPAGKPDAAASCIAFNETEGSVSVSCEPGYSGGVDQSFLVEAWDDGVVRATDTSDSPLLHVTGLRPGTRYTLKVFAVNAMGRSQAYVFTAFTLTDVAERRTAIGTGVKGEPLSPIVGSVIGGVSALLLVVVVAVVVAKCRRRRSPHHHRHDDTSSQLEGVGGGGSGGGGGGRKGAKPDPSTTTTTRTPGPPQTDPQGPDIVSASQESTIMTHSHDSTTPLIGNGRLLQGKPDPQQLQQQQQLYQQQQQQQQPYRYTESQPPQQPTSQPQQPQHVVLVDAGGGGVGGGGGGGPFYHQEEVMVEGVGGGGVGGGGYPPRQKMGYRNVYDYQHHSPLQSDCEWPVSESAWGSAPGGTLSSPPQPTTPCSTTTPSAYGVVDPRRHSAYLRPLDQIPSNLPHPQPSPATLPHPQHHHHLQHHQHPHHQLPSYPTAATTTTLPPSASSSTTTPTVTRFTPEHESSV